MSFLIAILFIWCGVLYVRIDKLQKQVDKYLSNKKSILKDNQETENQVQKESNYQAPKYETEPEPINLSVPEEHEKIEEEKAEQIPVSPSPEPIVSEVTPITKEEYLRQMLTTGSKTINAKNQPAKINQKPAPTIEFTAAKLFSWIGGFLLFLAAVFGLIYVLQNNILSPSILVFISFGIGAVLATWGYILTKKEYRITSHTLMGSGFAIIYFSIFSAYTFFELINLETSFVLMAFVSFLAMISSMHKEAKYVGYLGAIIAFLTPILIHSGKDSWAIFFSYVLCINSATAYAAVKKSWNDLFKFTLLFTWLCQIFWLFPFQDYKINCIIIFFTIYALASAWLIKKQNADNPLSKAVGTFLCMELFLMLPVSVKINTLSLSIPFLIYVLLLNLSILFFVGRQNLHNIFANWGKSLSFLIVFFWLVSTNLPLWLTLGVCLLFTAINSGVELLPAFRKEKPIKIDNFSLYYPIAVMAIIVFHFLSGTISLFNFTSIFVILCVLFISGIVLAVLAEMLFVVFISAILLLIFIAGFIFIGEPVYSPFVLGYSLIPLFLSFGTFLTLRKTGLLKEGSKEENTISFFSSLMPFILVLMVLIQKTNTNIHWILGATFVICAINILVAKLYKNTSNVPMAVLGAGFIQLFVKDMLVNSPHTALLFTLWSLALFVLFAATPFLNKQYLRKTETWIASSLSGIISCLLGCMLVKTYVPALHVGFVPAVFLIIYICFLFNVWGNNKEPQSDSKTIAFMSGAVLLFLTIIFPLELHSSWLAMAWALEAAFLAYLNKILPYRGWQITSVILGIISAAWLLLGKVIEGHLPSTTNNYLPIYIFSACSFGLIAFFRKDEKEWKTVFYSLCGLTLFWLLNIEIAYYYATGDFLKFAFTGNLAEALTYTLAWALYGLIAMSIGLLLQKKAVLKTGIWVMALPLAKFLLSDMWLLELKYRIFGSLALAIMLISISFWYQKRQK
ncbi:MAG: DUF2339 domain-containing protein [Elusimicrobiaceae bacterium]|nr:DUF2339 domain-containing protein [Elusimicrobiaceae bacterium]